ncbi:hypothetical protein [Lactobacillus delbrueckii]
MSNSEYDRLIADSKTTASSSQRVSDLQKAEAILLEVKGSPQSTTSQLLT